MSVFALSDLLLTLKLLRCVEICGSKVRLWKPTGTVSDTTLEELDPQGTFLAMVKELKGLTQRKGFRARIVVKDFARGPETARQEGISSPTPSIESLRLLLGAATGMWTGGRGYAIHVSQAFKVCVRLPSSISTLDNEPVFLEAYKGLNGLVSQA